MSGSLNWFYLCIIFTFDVVFCQYFDAAASQNGKTSSTSISDVVTECETPNQEYGFCVDIRKCRILLNQLTNKKSLPFILASRCGPNNSTKVCCGTHDNFRHVSEIIDECVTPNQEHGYCVDIRMCKILLIQLTNKKSLPFILASRCGSKDSTKVCCGTHGNFRNVSGIIDEVLPKSCGRQKQLSTEARILGGRKADIGEFPWMAVLLHKNQYGDSIMGCSGFLIHTKYVVTAAHCTHANAIKHKGPISSILLGEHDIQTLTDCTTNGCVKNTQNLKINKVVTHPDYNPTSMGHYNDVALIQLKRNAKLTEYVKPICLIQHDSQIPDHYFLSGWGRTETKSHSKVKLYVKIPSFDKIKCIETFSSVNIKLKHTQICAGGEAMADSCTGDSGGPLMMVGSDETWFASGIVSFGIGCGTQGWPGVYTSVAEFLPWIKSQMEQ